MAVSFNCMCMMHLSATNVFKTHVVQFHGSDGDFRFQKKTLWQRCMVSVWNPVIFHMCGASHHFDGGRRVSFEEHLLGSELHPLMSL